MTLKLAQKLAQETDYAIEATHTDENPINWADASAFYLEGWRQGMADAAAIAVGSKTSTLPQIVAAICIQRDHVDA